MTPAEMDAFLADTIFSPRDEDDEFAAVVKALNRAVQELAEEARRAAEED